MKKKKKKVTKKEMLGMVKQLDMEVNEIWESVEELNDGRPSFDFIMEMVKATQKRMERIDRIDELVRKLDKEVGEHCVRMEILESKVGK